MLRALRCRRWAVAVLAVACLLAPAAGGATPDGGAAVPGRAHIDPNLERSVAAGPAPALLSWDRGRTSHGEVAGYLAQRGIAHRVFAGLPMAVVCATRASDLAAVAAAPGAISVWGDEPMTPVLAPALPARPDADAGTVATGVFDVTGDGVGIAVLDTGVDGNHPDLQSGAKTVLNAQVLVSHLEVYGPGNDSCFVDTYDERTDTETVSGHGTHIAGVAAGSGAASDGEVTGIAPGADVVGVGVAEQSTPESRGDASASLIRFMAGVNFVITRSLDAGPTVTKVALLGWTSEGLFDPWHPHYLAIRDLYDFGISVVVPVGNGGSAQSTCDSEATCHFNGLAVGQYPIAVGATTRTSPPQLEDYSSRGDPTPRDARGSLFSYEPTLVAPGTDVLGPRRVGLATFGAPVPTRYPLAGQGAGAGDDVTNTDYQAMSGTSVAAAHVAGTIALMQQAAIEAKSCYLSPAQVRQLLQSTATAMPGLARWEAGAGALDIAAAVEAARAAPVVTSRDPWNCPRTP